MSALSQAILQDAPVSYFRCNEQSGTVAYDSTTNGHNGTYHGAITYNEPGATIDGDTSVALGGFGNYISVPTTGLPTGANPWSIEGLIWMAAGVPTNDPGCLAQFGNWGTNGQAAFLGVHSSGKPVITIFGTDVADASTISTTGWHHLVATYDGTTLRLYVDNVLVNSGAATVNLVLSSASIGALSGGNSVRAGTLVDEVAFYNTCLSAARISAHYTALTTANPPTPPSLIVKQQVIKVYDQSGHFLDIWRDAPLLGLDGNSQPPKFAINTVTGQASINLPRPFDNFDEGGDHRGRGTVQGGNVVQVWVYDQNTLTSGRLVFQGYIDGYIPQIGSDGSEMVQVLITPFDAALGDVKFIGTEQFGTAGVASSYVDTMFMFRWPFAPLYAAWDSGPITSAMTSIGFDNVTGFEEGMSVYLLDDGGTDNLHGPYTITNISGLSVTFSSTLFNWGGAVYMCQVAGVQSKALITGSPQAFDVVSTTGLTPNMPVKIYDSSGDTENATISSIEGNTVTFTAPLQHTYAGSILSIFPPLSWNTILNQPYPYPLTLDASTPQVTGQLASAQLHNQSFVDWFESVRNISPLNWYWYVTPSKTVIFNQIPTTAQHSWTIGKDISQPQYQKDWTNLKNHIYVKGTGVSATAIGSDVSVFGDRMEIIVEPRIIDQNTAQLYANAVLGQLDVVDYRSELYIVDKRGDRSGLGYDIETINVGDTCRIIDPYYSEPFTLWDAAIWDLDAWDYAPGARISQVTVVSALTYKFDIADVELSSLQPSQDKYLTNLARQYENSQFN